MVLLMVTNDWLWQMAVSIPSRLQVMVNHPRIQLPGIQSTQNYS